MGANRTSFLANRRLQPLGHLSGSVVVSIAEEGGRGWGNRGQSGFWPGRGSPWQAIAERKPTRVGRTGGGSGRSKAI